MPTWTVASGSSLLQAMGTMEPGVAPVRPDLNFMAAVERASGQLVSNCYRCLKCTAGCPLADEMDSQPDGLVRMVHLGLRGEALSSRAIWLCTGCLACSDRCPNGIDVARVVDTLKQMAIMDGIAVAEPRVATFHRAFLDLVRRHGRLHEASLIAVLKLKSRDVVSDLGLGVRLLLKGKIPPLPRSVREKTEIEGLFRVAGSRDRGASGGGCAG